ncbi:MAG: TlpA disulfide reductase family protein [Nannocystaceae bacterium]
MRSARVLAVSGLLLGCTITTSSEAPEPAAEPAAALEPVAQDEPKPASEPAPEPEPERVATGPGALTADGGETEPPGADDGGDEPSTTIVPAEPAAPSTETKPQTGGLKLPRPMHATTDSKCGEDPGVGQPLKAFSLPTPEGKTISSGSFRGRVMVVNFWGTWCKPCLKELPEFDQLYRRYRKHGMTLVAIATDEEPDAVTEYLDKRKLAAKVAIGGETYATKYGSPKFPFTFVVDYKGIIRGAYRGYRPECMGQLEADIREQLQVRAEAKAKRSKG